MPTHATRPALTQYAYEEYETSGPRAFHRCLWPAVIRQLDARLDRESRILDAGCGNGSLCAELSDRYDVCGFDLSESGIRLARQSCPACDFRVASAYDDIRELFGRDFDAVTSLEVIEHLYAPREFLRRVRDALAPQGLLILSTPYHGYLKNVAVAVTGRFDQHFRPLRDGGDIKFWSVKTLTSVLHECGFELLRWEGAGRFPFFWKSMVAVARKNG